MLAAARPNRVALGVFGAGFLLILLLDALVRDEPTPKGDDLIYEKMAQDPFGTHTYVFAYRVAVPWLVHVLPFDHTFSFSVLAWLCSAAAGAVLFLLLEHFEIDRRISLPLAIALVLSPPLLVASLRQGRNPDPLTVLVMVSGCLFIVRRQPLPLTLVMLVGAANRESALFLGPLAYAVWAEKLVDFRVLRDVALASLPAVAVFATLRLTLDTVGREAIAGYSGPFIEGRIDVIEEAWERKGEIVRRLATAFGPLWLLAPFAFRSFTFAQRGLVLIGLCVVAMFFAHDWGRIAFIAAPVVYAAGAYVLQRHPRYVWPTMACMAFMVVGYAVYMQTTGVDNIIEFSNPRYPVQ